MKKTETQEESMKPIDDAREYVIEKQDLLRQAYGPNYIVVREGVVLASHAFESHLARWTAEKFPGEAVLIGTIDDIVNPKGVDIPYLETEN